MSYQADIWKKVASGGRWTPAEVRAELPGINAQRVANAMSQMASSGSLTKFEDGRYGITLGCLVPRNMTVQEVLAVTGAKP